MRNKYLVIATLCCLVNLTVVALNVSQARAIATFESQAFGPWQIYTISITTMIVATASGIAAAVLQLRSGITETERALGLLPLTANAFAGMAIILTLSGFSFLPM